MSAKFKDIHTVRRDLKRAYFRLVEHGGWRAVGREFKISGRMAWRISERDYEPKDPHIRAVLRLPAYTEVPVCPYCGEVHVKKGCPNIRKRNPIVKETELAEFVIHWLQSQNWEVYQEVQFNHYSTIADIVAVRQGIMWVIETKTSMTMDVLYQASRWPVHYRSIAVPKSVKRNGDHRALHYRVVESYYRVGVLEVDCSHIARGEEDHILFDRIYEVIRPPLFVRNHEVVKRYLQQLTEEHKTYARAGQVAGHRWTPYRSTMETVKHMVKAHPGCTIKDIFDENGIMHYASPESFKGSLLKALDDFERDWCRIDKSVKPYRLYLRE